MKSKISLNLFKSCSSHLEVNNKHKIWKFHKIKWFSNFSEFICRIKVAVCTLSLQHIKIKIVKQNPDLNLKTRNMKKLTKISAISILMIGSSLSTFAQANATATATATIITPISIINAGTNMSFGNVAVQAGTGGTVILAPAATRTTGGAGGVTLPTPNGTVTAALFTVNGQGTNTFAITLPVDGTVLIGDGTNTMAVNSFTSTPAATGTLVGGTLPLSVGATLIVPAGQAAGTYISGGNGSGPFTVTVNYN